MPKWLNKTSAGADAPKLFIPTNEDLFALALLPNNHSSQPVLTPASMPILIAWPAGNMRLL